MRQAADFSAAHGVGLSSERERPAAGLADLAGGQMQIVNRVVLVHADAALVDAHAPERKRLGRLAKDQRRFDDQTLWDAADRFDGFRRIVLDEAQKLGETVGMSGNKLTVKQIFVEQNIEHGVEQRDIGTRTDRQVQIGEIGGLGAPRIDADDRHLVRRAQLALFDTFKDHRMAIRGVGADQENAIGLVDVRVGVGRTVRAKRSFCNQPPPRPYTDENWYRSYWCR